MYLDCGGVEVGDEPEVWGNVLFFENGSLKKLAVFSRTNGNSNKWGSTLGGPLHKTNACRKVLQHSTNLEETFGKTTFLFNVFKKCV